MQNLELVIFDMDGLMFDTEQVSFICFKEATRLLGRKLERSVFDELLGVNITRAEEIYHTHFGADFPFDQVIKKKLELAKAYIEQHGVVKKPGLTELLDFLVENNIRRVVATSSHRSVAADLLEKANIADKIDEMVCGDEITHSKPDPEIFLKAAVKLQVPLDRALVLEDSRQGILAAHRANIKAIMIPDMLPADAPTKLLYFKEMASLHEVKDYIATQLANSQQAKEEQP